MFEMYVYRYSQNSVVIYIGIVTKGTIRDRHNNHKWQDKWCNDDLLLEYIELSSKSECEAFESHFIAYYHTYNFYNKAKSDWGLNSFLPLPEYFLWTKYNPILHRNQNTNTKRIIEWLYTVPNGTIFKADKLLKETGLSQKQFQKVKEKNNVIKELFISLNNNQKRGFYIINQELIHGL